MYYANTEKIILHKEGDICESNLKYVWALFHNTPYTLSFLWCFPRLWPRTLGKYVPCNSNPRILNCLFNFNLRWLILIFPKKYLNDVIHLVAWVNIPNKILNNKDTNLKTWKLESSKVPNDKILNASLSTFEHSKEGSLQTIEI